MVFPPGATAERQAERLDAERERIDRAKRGDLDAMRLVFETYADPLYRSVILPRLSDRAGAEDVLRDTFAAALQKLDTFRWTGTGIYPWLRQIAVNKVFDHHRRTQRSRRFIDQLASETAAATEPAPRPDAQLIAAQDRRERRHRIDDALSRLPDRYRQAIELRLIEERPRADCARALGVKLGTFDVIFYRAVRSFRHHFGGGR